MVILAIIISTLFIFIITENKFIEAIDEKYDDYLYLDLCFGNPKQEYQLKINTNKITSFINSAKFNKTQSISGKEIEIVPQIIDNTDHNTIKYSDIISLENNIFLNNFLFYIVNETEYLPMWDEGLAFGYCFNDTSFSFIHMLYKEQLISHKKFGFVVNDTSKGKKASIFLGSIPFDRLSGFQYKLSLDVKHKQIEWNVFMKKININKNVLHLNKIVIINTAQFYKILNNEIFDWFCNVTLYPYLQNKKCERFDEIKRSYVKCYDRKITNELGRVTFFFDNRRLINVDLSLFFTCFGNLCFSSIGGDNTKQGTFEIGYNFLKIFNATEFDYETEMICLYSDTFIFGKENNPLIAFISVCISVICLCMCIFIYLIKRN